MKKQYEGETAFKHIGKEYRSCTYSGNCLWKVTYRELVIAEQFGGRDSSHVSKFSGHICNSPYEMITTCPQ